MTSVATNIPSLHGRQKKSYFLIKLQWIPRNFNSNKGKKEENDGSEVCTIYLCWGDILKRPPK